MKKSSEPKTRCTFAYDDGHVCPAYAMKGQTKCYGHARKLGLVPPGKDVPIEPFVYGSSPIQVEEPRVLKALREFVGEVKVAGDLDPVVGVQIANMLRPLFGLPQMVGEEFTRDVQRNTDAVEEIAARELSTQRVIEQSRALIQEHPDPAQKAAMEARVQQDLQDASNSIRTKMERTRDAMLNQRKVQIAGTGEDELYMVNGVRCVIPADGIFEVPLTIAELHQARIRGRAERKARSELMMSTPEYTAVQRGMAEIDSRFGSRSQISTTKPEETAEITAREIK